jgi:GTP-binding protein
MKPVIAVVGRPNVGKSTLFNRMTKSRDAIVADFAGLTRDRHYGNGRLADREYIVIDTGGFEPDSSTGIVKEMAKQTRQAVAEADAVIFVVDIRTGVSAQDHDIARYLRSVNKKVFLAANKAEGMVDSPLLGELYELGMGEPHPISSAHGQGIRSLLDAVLGFINIQQNELFKILTIVSVVGVPPTILVGIWGMNFKHMPELDWTFGYPLAWLAIIASGVLPLIWFKRRGWFE